MTTRRGFLGGLVSTAAFRALGGALPHGAVKLRFGVVSDIHVTTPESAELFEASLRIFKARGADAVLVPGDLTDWGLVSSLRHVREAWDRVFAGTDVVPLFCTGNHDFDGYGYGDVRTEMHANGYSEDDKIVGVGMEKVWQEVFGEPYAPVRVRTVKGYDFVSVEWGQTQQARTWMQMHANRFDPERPFFYFQHAPMKGTTIDGDGWADKGDGFAALKDFPSAIAFTGHSHCPFVDERLIWQDEFTAIATPSLSYACFPKHHENGEGDRTGKSKQAMPVIPDRRDLRGGQGFFVSVYADEMVVERLDLEEGGVEGAPPWIIPLGGRKRPYRMEPRAAASVAPVFPVGAAVKVATCNAENRSGHWITAVRCTFPAALPPAGQRVFDYELRVVPTDRSRPLVKRFLSPAYSRLAKYEPNTMSFWFDAAELPRSEKYQIEVYARNCFGKCSAKIVSSERRHIPGPLPEKTPEK